MSVMPSITATIRDNIVAAIRALPGWPQEVPVEKLGLPQDAFFRGHRAMVGVCLTTDKWTSIDLGLGDNLDQPCEMDLQIVVYATSELSPAGALDPDDGNIDGLVGMLLGSNRAGYGRGLRDVDVGVPSQTGAVRCRAVSTSLMADQKRAEGAGGAMAKVLSMRTTVVAL